MGNPFDDAITSEARLRALHEMPSGLAARKEIHRLDQMSRRFIECSSVVFIATADPDGRCDVSPRGGPPASWRERDGAGHDATGRHRLE